MTERDKMLWQAMVTIAPALIARCPSPYAFISEHAAEIAQDALTIASEMYAVLELKTGVVERPRI